MPELRPGDVVGEYVLDQPLDEGGQGYIWRARRSDTASTFVALKILTKPDSSGEVGLLRREIEVLAATAANRSEHIVRVLGGAAEPVPYIVMEYVDGSDLRRELQRLNDVYGAGAGHFSQMDAVLAGIAVADALAALHEEGIIHRDVKPANVMMDRRGHIKLTDFGIAKIAGTSAVTAFNQQPLSLLYAAPEVWDGASVFTSDVYALGVTLFELLTGSPPFLGSTTVLYQKHLSEAPNLGALPPGTDPGLAELINACMAKVASERPSARVCQDILTTIKDEITQHELDTQTGLRHEPEFLRDWRLVEPHPARPWAWSARHRDSGVEGVVELHFAEDLATLEQRIGLARHALEVNPRLVPLGAERLIAVNRFLLGPSEAWAQEPPGRFSYFVVRAEEPQQGPPVGVSKALLLTAAQALAALIQQANAEGIYLDLSTAEMSVGAGGRIHLAHPGLGPQDGPEMERSVLDFLRGLTLEPEASAVIEGAPSLAALITVLSQPPPGPRAYVWEEIQTAPVPAEDTEATQIVRRPVSAVPDDASATQVVARPLAPEPPVFVYDQANATTDLPPPEITPQPVSAGTGSGARFDLLRAKPWLAVAAVAAVAVCAVLGLSLMGGDEAKNVANPAPSATTATSARTHLNNFAFGSAITDFTTAINAQPDNASLYSGRAGAYLSQADLPKAQADANKAIELDPKNAEAYHVRSLVFGTRWNYDDAIRDASKAIELEPANAIYYAARSQTYADREPAKALQDATKAVELGPNVAEAHIALGSVYRDQKKYAEAEAEIAKAINLQPKNGSNYLGRAYLFWVKGDGDQAVRRLTEDRAVIDSYPLSAAQGHVTRGVFAHGVGKYSEALAEFDKSNALLPSWPSFYFWHGFTSYTQKDFATALTDYNKAIEIAPAWPSLFYLRSALFRDQNKLPDALADLNKAVSLDANNASYRSERGFIQYGLKSYPEAIADLTQAITLDPEVADTYSRRGNVYIAQGNNQAAIDDFTKAIQKNGAVLQYYLDRGTAYQRLNRLNEAQADYQKARSLAATPDEVQRTQAALDSLRR